MLEGIYEEFEDVYRITMEFYRLLSETPSGPPIEVPEGEPRIARLVNYTGDPLRLLHNTLSTGNPHAVVVYSKYNVPVMVWIRMDVFNTTAHQQISKDIITIAHMNCNTNLTPWDGICYMYTTLLANPQLKLDNQAINKIIKYVGNLLIKTYKNGVLLIRRPYAYTYKDI